jgi:hypothetical protein
MRPHRRFLVLEVLVAQEVRGLTARLAPPAGENRPSFRALDEAETRAILGAELTAALLREPGANLTS